MIGRVILIWLLGASLGFGDLPRHGTPTGQPASETGPWTTNTVSYGYNQGHRASLSLSLPSGSPWSQSYGYDLAWRMTNIASTSGAFGYQYPSSINQYRIGGIILPNGASILNQYDSLSRLTSTALLNYWGHPLDGYVYGLDSLGLRTNITRQLGLTTNNVSIGYDPIAEVSSWTAKEANGTSRQNEQLGYGYDAGGNLHLRTNNALVQTFTADSLNQLNNAIRSGTLTVSGALPGPSSSVTVNGAAAQTNGDFTFASPSNTLANGGNLFTIIAHNSYGAAVTNSLSVNLPATVNFQYDANGNLTNDGARSFYYDAENRLTNVTVAGQYQTLFAYDGLSRRRIMTNYTWQSSAWVDTNETRYICDGMLVLQERNSNNIPVVTYTRGLDLSTSLAGAGGIGGLLARSDTNGTAYYHADGNGNITALMDGNQNIVARYEYDAFGRLINKTGSLADANRIRFSSQESIPNANIYGYWGRFYDPTLQRWLNRDPIGEAGGINLYSAMGNNPVNMVDPYGLTWVLFDSQAWGQLLSDVFIGGGGPGNANPNSNLALRNATGTGITPLTDENGNIVHPGNVVPGALFSAAGNIAMLPMGEEEGAYKAAEEALKAAEAAKVAKCASSLPKVAKAVNSNLPHAAAQAAERGVFDSVGAAADALRDLSKSITQNGFPAGTLPDTAYANRVLVPIGNNGMAVYQVGANGTAILKTVLIAH